MKVSPADPRSIRTREQLRTALIQLAVEQHLSSLSIHAVTQRAGLNRTTFYLHYAGLHELLEDCARALFGQLRAEIYANKLPSPGRDPTALAPFVESVFRHLAGRQAFYRAMLGRQGDPLFRGLFQELLHELIFEPVTGRSPQDGADPQLEMIMRFFTAGFSGIAEWWLEREMPISSHQAALQITRAILPDYLRLMDSG